VDSTCELVPYDQNRVDDTQHQREEEHEDYKANELWRPWRLTGDDLSLHDTGRYCNGQHHI